MEKCNKKNICRNFMKNLKENGTVIELKKERKACFLRRGLNIQRVDFDFDTVIDNKYLGRDIIIDKMKIMDKKDEYVGMWLGDSFSKLDRLDILYALNRCYEGLKDDGLLYLSFPLGKEDIIKNESLHTCFEFNELLDFVGFSDFLIFDMEEKDTINIILKK